jgi:predicted transglutaminase-like cysteine proteinase
LKFDLTAITKNSHPHRWQSILQAMLVLLLLLSTLTAQGVDINRLRYHLLNLGGNHAENIFGEWRNLIEQSRRSNEINALKQVNDFFNQQIKFATDVQVWKKNDYWASPMQTLAMRKGDCEDFAIAKYFSLITANVPEQKLRLMYVQAMISDQVQQAHMVLAYYPTSDAEPLILDNLNPEIMLASSRKDLKPIYSLKRQDSDGYKTDAQDAQLRLKEAMRQYRMSIWEDLIKRAQAEGFD